MVGDPDMTIKMDDGQNILNFKGLSPTCVRNRKKNPGFFPVYENHSNFFAFQYFFMKFELESDPILIR